MQSPNDSQLREAVVEAFLVSTSAADDVAFLALKDLSAVLGGEDETGVIGGHMVSLLTATFPSPGSVARRTNDADGGIPRVLASSRTVHENLVSRGYEPSGSNRYIRRDSEGTERILDLLVPNLDTRLRTETLGGREFDSMPGLGLALASRLPIDVVATLSTQEELSFTTNVPTVEGAVILKTYAWAGRRALKDAIDLHGLFRIVEAHPVDAIGGWHLDTSPLVGARRDTSRTLHELARNWESRRPPRVTFDYRQLIAGIRTHVATPTG